MTDNVCWLDTETTGLDPDRHEIWEVGLILPDGGEFLWHLAVDLSRADPIALNIGRFHERYGDIGQFGAAVTGGGYVAPDGMASWSERFVRLTHGLHLCGAVISFDAERLWKLLRANGQCPMWHYHLIDVEALAAGWVAAQPKTIYDRDKRIVHGGPDEHMGAQHKSPRPPWKSEELSRWIGVNPDQFDRHTALGDARWAKAIYDAVMGVTTSEVPPPVEERR